jgi:hypothetical protein
MTSAPATGGATAALPIDTLKIDRAFVRGLATNADDACIVSAVIQMGKTGIYAGCGRNKTPEQLAFLGEELLRRIKVCGSAAGCRGVRQLLAPLSDVVARRQASRNSIEHRAARLGRL